MEALAVSSVNNKNDQWLREPLVECLQVYYNVRTKDSYCARLHGKSNAQQEEIVFQTVQSLLAIPNMSVNCKKVSLHRYACTLKHTL